MSEKAKAKNATKLPFKFRFLGTIVFILGFIISWYITVLAIVPIQLFFLPLLVNIPDLAFLGIQLLVQFLAGMIGLFIGTAARDAVYRKMGYIKPKKKKLNPPFPLSTFLFSL